MNTQNLTLAQAIEGFLLNTRARRLTEDTITGYTSILRRVVAHFPQERMFADMTVEDWEEYLVAQDGISDQTLLNHHNVLAALYSWAVSRRPPLVKEHLLRQIQRPKPEKRVIQPLSKAEVLKLLSVVGTSNAYSRPGKRTCANALPDAQRNRCIILVLVDTGMRASELCNLKISDANLKTLRLIIFGKGKKERQVRICPRTADALWAYLAEQRKDARMGDPLFITRNQTPLTRDRLAHILVNISKRAGIENAHPHRFRHTFAIEYLRNGGDPYTLQELLGHETMDIVKRYLQIAQVDLDAGHQKASPVDNWRL